MSYQTVFKRYELKYILSLEQKERLLDQIYPFIKIDKFGKSTIRNLYFDTSNYRLIRRSIEKPVYKEKLRIRSYAQASDDSIVFVELKKKYEKVVYKRRLPLTEKEATQWLLENKPLKTPCQISEEIDYFRNYYGDLLPTVFLSYDRTAYYARNGEDVRITFDSNILCRREELSLKASVYGERLLDENKELMEIKCSGGIPLWLTEALSREKLYKTSFSKYGTAYQKIIYPKEILSYA